MLVAAAAVFAAAKPVNGDSETTARAESASVWRLAYRIPPGWFSDRDTARRLEMQALLLPEGASWREGGSMIAIAFERKSYFVSSLKDLFMSEMGRLLAFFPDLESESWRPASLEDAGADVASLEVYAPADGAPSPQRLVMIDAGDGYYTINVRMPTREDLDGPDASSFFAGLDLIRLPAMGGGSGGS